MAPGQEMGLLNYKQRYYRSHKKEYREYKRAWCKANPEAAREIRHKEYLHNIERYRAQKQKLKMKVLKHYGGDPPKCARCGIKDPRVLTIDHINGGGNRQRKDLHAWGHRFYYWLKRNGYPSGFQVLCMNCQFIDARERFKRPSKFEEARKVQGIVGGSDEV
jgi:hypothetical protein